VGHDVFLEGIICSAGIATLLTLLWPKFIVGISNVSIQVPALGKTLSTQIASNILPSRSEEVRGER
jgi:hypothetical protein